MKRKLVTSALTVAALAAGLALLAFYHPPGDDDNSRYHDKVFTVVKVADGDTLDIDIPDGEHKHTRVRLWGVDTPETVDPRKVGADYYGPEASAFTKKIAAGQSVRIELAPGNSRDKYRRLLAYVYLPDRSMLNERLIEGGFGYADTRFEHPRLERFTQLEKRARRVKAGLWANVKVEQMPEWRQRREAREHAGE